eukprot:s3121_g4.t2
MQAAEPSQFRKANLEALSCKALRRVFYGMFRQPLSSRPTGKTKADIQEFLLREYSQLGRPCAGKTIAEVIEQTELLLSGSLVFTIHETQDGRQYISSENQSRWLPAGPAKMQTTVFRDAQKIPCITNGTESFYCLDFFKSSDPASASSAAKPSAPPSASTDAPPLPAPAGRPSFVDAPISTMPGMATAKPICAPPPPPGPPRDGPPGTPSAKGEIAPPHSGEVAGYVLKQGKHKGEVFAGSPSTPKASCWLQKLTWALPPQSPTPPPPGSMDEWRKSVQEKMAREAAEELRQFREDQMARIQQENAEREKGGEASRLEQDKKDEMERLQKEAAAKLEQDKKDEMERLQKEAAAKLEQDKKDEMERLQKEAAAKIEQDKKDEMERLQKEAAGKVDAKDIGDIGATSSKEGAPKPADAKTKDGKRKKAVIPP